MPAPMNDLSAGAIRFGSCGHLSPDSRLTWSDGDVAASWGGATFTVIPRCAPPDLVRLWCGVGRKARVLWLVVARGRPACPDHGSAIHPRIDHMRAMICSLVNELGGRHG